MDGWITQYFDGVAKHLSAYVAALSILGGVSMALLQMLKDLLPIRQRFQKYYLSRWMKEGAAEAGLPPTAAATAENDLVKLAVDGDAAALYDLQIEQLCGQYTAAIQIVLEYPANYPDLLRVTASQAQPADVDAVLTGPAVAVPPAQAFLDARNRVTHQCQRAIDALQIAAGFRWKWIFQLASILLSVVLAWIAMSYKPTIAPNPVSVLVTALLAGFLAPVVKDLLAVLQKARGQ